MSLQPWDQLQQECSLKDIYQCISNTFASSQNGKKEAKRGKPSSTFSFLVGRRERAHLLSGSSIWPPKSSVSHKGADGEVDRGNSNTTQTCGFMDFMLLCWVWQLNVLKVPTCHLPRQLDQRAGQTQIVHSLDLSLFLDLQGFTGSLWSSAYKGKTCCLRFRSSQIASIFYPAQDGLLNNRSRYQRLIKALFSKHQIGVYPGFQKLDII